MSNAHRDRTFVGRIINFALRAATLVAVTLVAAPAHAASACPSVDAAWFLYTATGARVSYGYTVDGTIQANAKTNTPGTPFSAVGVVTLLGTSVQSDGDGATITGYVVSGVENQNVGGAITTLSFGGTQDSAFTFATSTCTGTLTRVYTNGPTVVWQIVAVDGENTFRYMDTRANPSVRTGSLQLMK